MADSEARRGLHYADDYTYEHVEFGAPFSPLDYLSVLEHLRDQGCKTIIVDSMSHEHAGAGGVLDMHDAEMLRLGRGDYNEKYNFPAWKLPKAERQTLINAILQMPVNFIFCFRAREKSKPQGGKLVDLGFMPIAGEEFIFEMTLSALLLPNAGGVPTWQGQESGEKMMIKLPEQFRKELLNSKEPLSEATGEMLARWAAGTSAPPKAAAPVLFAKQYAEYGGSPIVDAPPSVVDHYVETLLATLNDDAKRGLHSQVRAHLDRVLAAAAAKAATS